MDGGPSAGEGVSEVPNLACNPAIGGSPPSSSSAQSKFAEADKGTSCRDYLCTNSRLQYRDTDLGLVNNRNGLLDSHLIVLSGLNRRGNFHLCYLVLRHIHPILTVLRPGVSSSLSCIKWNPADVEDCPPRPAAGTSGTSGCSSEGSGASGLGSSGTAEVGSEGGFAKACAKSRRRESDQRHHVSKSGSCNSRQLHPREIPSNSPSPERIPRINKCLTSLSSPRSCSAAASTIEISESSRPSGDTLEC
ncbi:hypothetical protein EI94DRAFT_596342 [Lactarius quietus]|nr:hypothetical protein EI94DRAFT_596342 [Lactarius quietus]